MKGIYLAAFLVGALLPLIHLGKYLFRQDTRGDRVVLALIACCSTISGLIVLGYIALVEAVVS